MPTLLSLLQSLERIGNRLPNPTQLFVWLCLLIPLLSALAASLDWQAQHPQTQQTIYAVNLLNSDGIQRMFTDAVTNFAHFTPIAMVLVAVLGIGVAESSGLLRVTLRSLVLQAPGKALTFIVVLTGVLSSLAADAGYVVLLPLAGALFAAAGRSPLLGIAAAFAGVSGGYSANLMITPLDAVLAGLSSEAAQVVASGYQVAVTGNYYFILASTLLIALIGTFVTEYWLSPWLGQIGLSQQDSKSTAANSPEEKRALTRVAIGSLAYWLLVIGVIYWWQMPVKQWSKSLVPLMSLYFAGAGWLFGHLTHFWHQRQSWIHAMESSIATLAPYIVLMFFAAQFINYFNWSQLGIISAIQGAEWLQSLELPKILLLLCFVLFSACLNLLIGSASAKWALLAPVFVPMLLLLNISPEATQIAYRIGDSSTNIITPLMPYFGFVVVTVQRYHQDAGVGTLMAMMLPFSIAFLAGWTLLLLLWAGLDWPLGPGASLWLKAE